MKLFDSKWSQRGSGVVLLVYLTALITGTHLPHPEELISLPSNDKLLHFGAYFGLAFLMATRLQTLRPVTWRAMLVIGCLAATTGAVDELTQMLPGINRHCEFADWLANLRDRMARGRIAKRLALLEAGHLGDVKPVGGKVSELRIDHGPGYRLYFTRRGEALILLLIGGDKGSQRRDISKARAIAERFND